MSRKIEVLFRDNSILEFEVTGWIMGEDKLVIWLEGLEAAEYYRDVIKGVREVNLAALREENERRRAKFIADQEAGIFPSGNIDELKEKGWQ